MHKVDIPDWVVSRVVSRRGKAHVFDDMVPARTALLVVDMQNCFLKEEIAHGVIPEAREIVPNINRLAKALREGGGLVCWIQAVITDKSLREKTVFHDYLSRPELRDRRIACMRDPVGRELWSELDVQQGDEIVQKTQFSAFIQGSSNLEEILRARGMDTVVITGTVTNVCCESTARDAMMRNFKTVMVSDANASRTDEEHNAALRAFYLTFGDVMTTDQVIGYLGRNAARTPAAAE